jgi:hypothetical protein
MGEPVINTQPTATPAKFWVWPTVVIVALCAVAGCAMLTTWGLFSALCVFASTTYLATILIWGLYESHRVDEKRRLPLPAVPLLASVALTTALAVELWFAHRMVSLLEHMAGGANAAGGDQARLAAVISVSLLLAVTFLVTVVGLARVSRSD